MVIVILNVWFDGNFQLLSCFVRVGWYYKEWLKGVVGDGGALDVGVWV